MTSLKFLFLFPLLSFCLFGCYSSEINVSFFSSSSITIQLNDVIYPNEQFYTINSSDLVSSIDPNYTNSSVSTYTNEQNKECTICLEDHIIYIYPDFYYFFNRCISIFRSSTTSQSNYYDGFYHILFHERCLCQWVKHVILILLMFYFQNILFFFIFPMHKNSFVFF